MTQDIHSQIEGGFTGYHDAALFKLTNGQAWQQRRYKYSYRYKYRPHIRIYREGNHYMMEVDCMKEPIEVVRVNILEEGVIISNFIGFSGDTTFEFQNRHVWKQDEYKYNHHYAHRPQAIVVDGINGKEIHVDGMSESVRVRKIC